MGEITKLSQDELKKMLKETRQKLALQQQLIKEKKLPVFVLVEGFGASGKGTLISYLIRDLDPRFFQVVSTKAPTEDELRKPFLYRHALNMPEAGKFVFMDSGWLEETVFDSVDGKLGKKALKKRLEEINIFERQLVDNGYLVLKIFVNVSEEEQKSRIEKLLESKDTAWRVSARDKDQIKHRKKYESYYDDCIAATNTEKAPWHVVDGAKKELIELQVCRLLVDGIEESILRNENAKDAEVEGYVESTAKPLSEVSLDCSVTEEEYDKELKVLQKKLKKLHNKLYRKGIPVIIAYEGWDAAGKGGNIKRMTSALDARGFEVQPIASPDSYEKNRMFLWRFWKRLPKTGHITIFDRTWYGRVMVERLEGFCSENDWKRAFNEMNEFEKMLSDWGAVVIKFWIHIDKDTQLARFTERQNTPAKQWKITDEDWRNREKWDVYEVAINEMIDKTSTDYAPWYIIPSNDKKYARLKTLQITIDAIEKKLAEE